MLTVMELLSFPLFRNFKLVSGYGGLYNQVSGTGIFEWESSYDVDKNFEQGEFVITTLSLSRSDSAQAEASIRMLIDKKVSAVAIKDIYFHEISEALKAYSDARRVPVFFFSDTFFDDIIYTIKNTLLTQRRDFTRDEQVEFLLDTSHSAEQIRKKAKELNPFFHSSLICGFCSLKEISRRPKDLKAPHLNPEETVYSVIDYQQGILVIFTQKGPSSEKIVPDPTKGQSEAKEDCFAGLEDRLMNFLEHSGLKKNLISIGVSNPYKGLEKLGAAIQECLYANLSCRLNRTETVRFCDSGLDQILFPAKETPWMKQYYNGILQKLAGYDTEHGTKLIETLLEYTANSGDIKLTAQKLFQHGNTIRYRVDKMMKLLNFQYGADAAAQLHVFARLHEIYQKTDEI